MAGGLASGFTASAEIFDPKSGSFTATGSMHRPRADHAAVLLPDGRALIAGGSRKPFSIEIYDLATSQFTPAVDLDFDTAAQPYPTLSGMPLLDDGKVLLFGRSEIAVYDPVGGGLRHVASLGANHHYTGKPLLLHNGKALILNIDYDEILDPDLTQLKYLTQTAPFLFRTGSRELTNLLDGKVLIAGGQLLDSYEDGFTALPSLGTARLSHKVTLLPDGTVLVTGGGDNIGHALASSELFDPTSRTFSNGPSML